MAAAVAFSMVFTGAVLLCRFDPRLLAAPGLVCVGTGNLLLAGLDLNADCQVLAWPGVIAGPGMGLVFVPMSTLAFQAIGSDNQDEDSGIYGVARSLGSSIGIAVVGWQLVQRMQHHWNVLAGGVTPFDAAYRSSLGALALEPGSQVGIERATAEVARQSQTLAFQDVFILTAWAGFLMLPVVIIMARPSRDPHSEPVHA